MANDNDTTSKTPATTSGGPASALQTSEHGGTTTLDNAVVSKIASIAAREVDGVHKLGGKISSALSGVVSRIRGDEHNTGGVGVEVGTRQAAVDLTLVALYPVPLQDLTQAVRDNVRSRIEELTGLEVVEVNIAVTDLHFPGEEDQSDESTSRVE